MRRIVAFGSAVTLLAGLSTTAAAQDEGDAAAWFAMMFTPYGALPPVVTQAMAGIPRADAAAQAFEIRYGRWKFDIADDYFHTVGVGGRVRGLGFAFGYETCDGCDGTVMVGFDFEAMLATRPIGTAPLGPTLMVGLRPALGVGVFTGDSEGYALAGTVDLPISVSVPAGTGGHFVPFLSPGFGVGRLDAGSDGETGVRPSIGAGVGFLTANGLGINLGWRRVFLEGLPSTLGLAVSVAR